MHLALLNFEGYFDFSFFAAACLEGRGTEKQSTVVLSDCLHLMVYKLTISYDMVNLMMKQWIMPPSVGAQGVTDLFAEYEH